MSGHHIATVGNENQIPELILGESLHGHVEPRVAMVGRSNVGKSSLINALMEKRLAQTSKDPGKTKLIHFYYWTETKKIIADLPGYGHARAAQTDRKRWSLFIDAYLKADRMLERALVLLDARHGPTPLDVEAIEFLSSSRIPVTFVFTKSDTLKTQKERSARHREGMQALEKFGVTKEQVVWVSVKSKDGLKQLTQMLKPQSD